jgi:ElaB/YqjD/DUF883 family membrane-anchored ribosome-binding protein
MINRFEDQSSVERLLAAPSEAVKNVMSHQGKALVDRLQRYVTAHPKESLLIAATAGVVLGWITKRR